MDKVEASLGAWLAQYNLKLAVLKEQNFVFTPENVRRGLADLTRNLVTDIPAVALVVNGVVGHGQKSVPVRIYHPEPDKALPVLVYFHGGGHMAGSIEVYDGICRKLSIAANRIVISVDYRLAPEFPYPAGIEDGETVLRHWQQACRELHLNYSPTLSLGGDSAGGAMSATLAHCHQNNDEIAVTDLLLIYPSLDYTLQCESATVLSQGYLLEKERINWYFDHYFQNNENRESVSPLNMIPSSSFPRTMVVSAGYCPLRDEAEMYVVKLRRHGVEVEHLKFETMIHAFLNLEDLVPEACQRFYREIHRFFERRRSF